MQQFPGWWQASDGKWYPPNMTASAPVAFPPPPQQWPQTPPQFAPVPFAPQAMSAQLGALTPAAVVALLGGIAMIVGSFLPWITANAPLIGSISRSGVEGGGDGWVTAGLGGAVACSAFLATRHRWAILPGVILATTVCGLFVLYEALDMNHRIAAAKAQSDLIVAGFGPGLPVIGAGLLAAFVAGLYLYQRS